MNRIILAYAALNAGLARRIDQDLSRIGIPFDHMPSGQALWPEQVFQTGEPVLLLVTDNLLTERSCMIGMLDALKSFPPHLPFLPVVADGTDADGNTIPTSIDRMVNMLHYMNHWQNAWMPVSTQYQNASGAEKTALEAELDILRNLANQTGEVITFLREKGAVTLAALEANDYALFFEKFGLSDWHGQYRRLALTPETPAGLLPETPLSSGILSPEPVDETPEPLAPEDAGLTFSEIDSAETPAPPPVNFVEQTLNDARFWFERGHSDRGLELLRTAAEEFPDEATIQEAYQAALSQHQPATTTGEQPKAPVETTPAPSKRQEAQPYELMGNTAYEKGDYLFAKYCWDRVAEIDPEYPQVFRKLGLMTAEHLHDYQETAVVYLKKALEANPDDEEALAALKGLSAPEQVVSEPDTPLKETPQDKPEVMTPPVVRARALALITGATSGIGRATANVFAREGYRLILTGRRIDRLVELKHELETAYGTDVLLLPFDVRDAGAVQSAFDSLPEAYRVIDVLINNAGLAKGLSPIHEGRLDHWETMIDTNIKGLLYVTRLVSPGMVERRKGHIINICSSAGKEVYPNGNVYCATKFAVEALTRGIRYDLHKYNIRVGQVSPGHVEETEFALNRFDGDAERARIYNDFQPLKAADVAEAIWFMVSRPDHVNIQDVFMFGTQQAASTIIDRSGRS